MRISDWSSDVCSSDLADASLLKFADNWFVRETLGMLRRTLARLDVTSRSLYALIEPGSCFSGTLLELALACDRSYMLDDSERFSQFLQIGRASCRERVCQYV